MGKHDNCAILFGLFSCFLLLPQIKFLAGFAYVLFMIFNAVLTGVTTVLIFPLFLLKTIFFKGNKKVDLLILTILGLGL